MDAPSRRRGHSTSRAGAGVRVTAADVDVWNGEEVGPLGLLQVRLGPGLRPVPVIFAAGDTGFLPRGCRRLIREEGAPERGGLVFEVLPVQVQDLPVR